MLGYSPQQQAELDGLDRLLAELQANRQQWQPSRPLSEQMAPIVQRIAQEQQSRPVISDGMVGRETTFSPADVDGIIARSVARNRLAASDASSIDPGHYQALRAAGPVVDPYADTQADVDRRAQVAAGMTQIEGRNRYKPDETLATIGIGNRQAGPDEAAQRHADFVGRNAVRAAGRGVLNPFKAMELQQSGVVPPGVFSPATTGTGLEALLSSGQLNGLTPQQKAEMILKASALQQQQKAADAANALAREQMRMTGDTQRYVADQQAKGVAARNAIEQQDSALKGRVVDAELEQKQEQQAKAKGLVPPTAMDVASGLKPGLDFDQVAAALSTFNARDLPPDQLAAIQQALALSGYDVNFFDRMYSSSAPSIFHGFNYDPNGGNRFGEFLGFNQDYENRRQRRRDVGFRMGSRLQQERADKKMR